MAPRRVGLPPGLADRVVPPDPEPAHADDRKAQDPAAVSSAARAICLRLLTARPRTRAELASALRRRGIGEDCAEEVLDRFAEVGLIDDEAFASLWVSSRHACRGLAGAALAGELRSRGVAPGVVAAAVDRLDPEIELATARQLVVRRLAATRNVSPEARLRRLVGMLSRKGYPPGLAVRVVRDVLAESAADHDPEALDTSPDGR